MPYALCLMPDTTALLLRLGYITPLLVLVNMLKYPKTTR